MYHWRQVPGPLWRVSTVHEGSCHLLGWDGSGTHPPLGRGNAHTPTPSTMTWAFAPPTMGNDQGAPPSTMPGAGVRAPHRDVQGGTSYHPPIAGNTATRPSALSPGRPPAQDGLADATLAGNDPPHLRALSQVRPSAQDGNGTVLGKGTPPH